MPQTERLAAALTKYADGGTQYKRSTTAAYHLIQRRDGVTGMRKTFTKASEDDLDLNPELKPVTIRADDLIREVWSEAEKLINAAATKDYGNAKVTADVVLGEGANARTILKDAPPTLLLWLQHTLTDLRTVIDRMPENAPEHDWTWDPDKGHFVSAPTQTSRVETRKDGLVIHPPTDKHPAQTTVVDRPVITGTWTTVHYSGGLEADAKRKMEERVQELLDAIRNALTNANATTVDIKQPARMMLDYITEGVLH